MGGHFDLSAKQKQIEELEKKTENPSFWINREAAEETLKQIWIDAIEKFKPYSEVTVSLNSFYINDKYMSQDKIISELSKIYSEGVNGYSVALARAMVDSLISNNLLTGTDVEKNYIQNDYVRELSSKSTITEMFKYTLQCLNSITINGSTNGWGMYHSKLLETTNSALTTFCDYLKSHRGINYYITAALKIISYIALGLAVILSGIDFVEAILSNEDDPLKKVFQRTVRRIVAAVLVFLAYIIVQAFLGLITELPGLDAEKVEICNELKIGTFK